MRTLLLIASLLLVGCATLAETPAQKRTWARVEACGGVPSTLTIDVAADGSFRGSGLVDVESRAFVKCMGGRW